MNSAGLLDLLPSKRLELFAGLCRHQKGPLAGRPVKLDPWQMEKIICPLLDTRDETLRRIYNELFVFIPRKNAKTTLIAILSLYFLLVDSSEPQPEIYCCASDLDQANLLFSVASGMILGAPSLAARCKVYKREIRVPSTGGLLKVIPSDAPGALGLSPSVFILDEVVACKNDELIQAMETGMGARNNPLSMFLSTAGPYEESLIGNMVERARKALSGEIHEPRFLPVLFEGDRALAWDDPKNWAIANPGLGRTVSPQYLEETAAKAANNPSKRAAFKIYHLNWFDSAAVSGFIDQQDWELCRANLTPEPDSPCFIGMDLSAVSDLTSISLVWIQEDRLILKTHSWIPEGALERAERIPSQTYRRWQDLGGLTILSGKTMDLEKPKEFLRDAFTKNNVQELVFDPWRASTLVESLELDFPGVRFIEFEQNFKNYGSAVDTFEKAALSRKIAHNGDPVLKHGLENVMMTKDANANRRPTKSKSTGCRIDALVAALMAVERAAMSQHQPEREYSLSFI
jgi:phage terminase large subunit-like protein